MFPKWYPYEEAPLDGNFIENHCEAIAEFCDVTVVFVHSLKSLVNEKYSVRKEQHGKLKVIRVYFQKVAVHESFGTLKTILRYLRAQHSAINIATQHGQPDILHAHVLTRSSILPLLMFRNIPLLISEHFSGFLPQVKLYGGTLKKLATEFVVKRAAYIVTPSYFLVKAMQKNGLKGNYERISNAVDTTFFQPNKAAKSNAQANFLHVSLMSETPKNVPTILRAFKQFLLSNPAARLNMVGDGPQLEEQKALAQQLGIYNAITFFGDIKKAEVARLMQQAHALLLPSDYEVQGCVAIEALACGTPVIASTIGGTQEYLTPENSILVKPKNVDELVNAMRKMWLHQAEYQKQALQTDIQSRVSYFNVGNAYYQLYLKALSQK